jgi:sugar lactone lactonase YvrE
VRGLLLLPALLVTAGCGSLGVHQLPPPATPAPAPPPAVAPAGVVVRAGPAAAPRRRASAGGRVVVLRPLARMLELHDGHAVARVGAGVGPAAVAADPRGRWAYVTDTSGDALLVFALRPRFELVHRVYLPGAPYAVAVAAGRLWVTLSARNQLAELNVRRRPQLLRRLPTIRRPTAVAAGAGGVTVAGDGRRELITPPR